MDDVLSYAREDLKRRGRIAEVARATGIEEKTLRNLRYGVTTEMRSTNYERLRVFYEAERAGILLNGEPQHAAASTARRQMA